MGKRLLVSQPFMTAFGVAAALSLCVAKGVATAPQDAAATPRAAAAQNEVYAVTWDGKLYAFGLKK